MHVVDEHQQASDLHGLVDAKFLGRLHGVGEVPAGIGQRQHLGFGGLSLQQERREVRRVQRVAHRAGDRATVGLDDVGCIGFERMTESIVSGQKVPAFGTGLHQGGACHLGQRHGVVGVMHGVGRAGFIGQAGGAGADGHERAFLFFGDLGHGQRGAGVGAADQHRQAVLVDPLSGFGAGHVGLVLVVGGQHFNRTVQDLATEILHRPLDHFTASGAINVGVQAGHVGDETDFDRAGALRRSGSGKSERHGQGE